MEVLGRLGIQAFPKHLSTDMWIFLSNIFKSYKNILFLVDVQEPSGNNLQDFLKLF